MVESSIFKTYDIRGIYQKEITPESLALIAKGLVSLWDSGAIVLARDGRYGGEEFVHILKEKIEQYALESKKQFTIIDVGLATTPMYYFLVNHLSASGGAMVTASHNPKEYSGVKPVGPKALPIGGRELLDVILTLQ